MTEKQPGACQGLEHPQQHPVSAPHFVLLRYTKAEPRTPRMVSTYETYEAGMRAYDSFTCNAGLMKETCAVYLMTVVKGCRN